MPKGFPKNGQRRKQDPARRCACCKHPEKARLESLSLAGLSLDKLAEKFGLSRDSIFRHMRSHVSDQAKVGYLAGPAKIAELAELASAESESILDYYKIVRSTLVAMLDKAATKGDANSTAILSGRLVEVLGAIGRLTGQISQMAGTVINITNNTAIMSSAPVADMQAGLIRVCAAHPEARADIIGLFRELDTKYAGQPVANAPKTIDAVREVANV